MTTINISIPDKLKAQAESLIYHGFYASFSDLVRDSVRKVIEKNKYDLWTEEAKRDYEKGRAVVLKNNKDISKYLDKL